MRRLRTNKSLAEANGSSPMTSIPPAPEAVVDEAFVDRLTAYLQGEATWAQVEGWTPEQLYAYAKMGMDFARMGQLGIAKEFLEFCRLVNPKDWYFSYALGYLHLIQGELDEAIAQLQDSCASPLERPEPHLLLAVCHAQAGHSDLASQEVRAGLTLLARVRDARQKKTPRRELA